MTGDAPKAGDKVAWKTSQGETTGKVVGKVTERTRIKGHVVAASPEHPEYVVESDRTGAHAAHAAEALTPTGAAKGNASR